MSHDLNNLRVFSQVVTSGSFTAAGKALRVPTSTVSRRVQRLEQDLGVRLLVRTTRSLSLTDAGRLYYDVCVRVLAELEEAHNVLSDAQETPKGLVRLSAPLEHGFTAQLVDAFLREYEEVRVEVEFSSRDVNIIEEGFDASIQAGALTHQSVIARKLMDSPFALVASPAYLERWGAPVRVQDLREHRCVIFGSSCVQAQWALQGPRGMVQVEVQGRVAANHLLAVRDAALGGHGIALLPTLACGPSLRAGALVVVLPDAAPPAVPLYVTYPAGRHPSAAVRAFVAFARQHFGAFAKA